MSLKGAMPGSDILLVAFFAHENWRCQIWRHYGKVFSKYHKNRFCDNWKYRHINKPYHDIYERKMFLTIFIEKHAIDELEFHTRKKVHHNNVKTTVNLKM